MARPLRIDFPDAYHHVTTRGVVGQDIFLADADRESFLARLAEAHKRWGIIIHGYCLMTNHVHLELRTPRGELSRATQWVLQGHAAYLNRRHGRVGHVFQGRFRSVLVEAESHLHELTRYIHLNPVRAGLTASPADYAWSSYRSYVGLAPTPSWLETTGTLERFGGTRAEQVRRYRRFVESALGDDPLQGVAYGAVLGTAGFVARVAEMLGERGRDPNVARLAQAQGRPSAEEVFEAVARGYGADPQRLRRKGARRNEARDVAIYLARHRWGIPLREIGELVGGLGAAAVSLADRRIAERLDRDGALRKRVAGLGKIGV